MNRENYQTYEVSSNLTLEVVDSRGKTVLSDHDEALVDRLWLEAQKSQAGTLFNGKMLSFVSFENDRLIGRFVEYKYYRAQVDFPELKFKLNIRPIAISCSCLYQNEILIGQRSQFVSGYPGYFELVPSGGIDPGSLKNGRVDPATQALTELSEEAAIPPDWVSTCKPLAVIYEIDTAIFEIYIEINLHKRNSAQNLHNGEYAKLQWMPLESLLTLTEKGKESFVPLSLFLIDRFLMARS